jgi:DNA-binding winged helix-turn-helix (wHTH) protein
MAEARSSDGERPQRRRWSFADCTFDEANWTLTVGGRRVAVEHKPLELLRELLLHAGNLVTKDDLLDAIWPDVIVVEASLPTAVRKLRLALGDDERPAPIIETAPRIGYRLTVPVTVEEPAGAIAAVSGAATGERRALGKRGLVSISALAAVAIGAAAFTLASSPKASEPRAPQPISQQDAVNAIRRLDVDTIEHMLAAGWNPNAVIGPEGNAALHLLMEICEWNPGHDRNRLLLMERTLYEGGGRLDQRNAWGDTPYSIARAQRFCGPDHPVTRSMYATCFAGAAILGDRCLATYELARRRRS